MLARILAALGLMALVLLTPVSAAETIQVGDRVELKATSPAGVPLHSEARSSMFGRAADGSIGTVQEVQSGTNWIRLTLEDGRAAWIVRRYVGRVLEGGPIIDPTQDAFAVWSSAQQCEQVVRAGRRMPPAQDGTFRIAAWNVRWFPDGDLNNTDPAKRTDLPWLACAIAWLNVDILALEEIRTTTEAHDAWESVKDGLFGLTGQTWEVDLQSCGAPSNQHVGFLWNTARVSISDSRDDWHFNGAAQGESGPCAGNLRPGRYVIAVHLDSGTTERDKQHRDLSIDRMDQAVAPLLARDTDVVILGDFNTMGTNAVSADQEIADLTTKAAQEAPGFKRLNVEPQCSEYFNGHGGLLDQILVTNQMTEAPAQSTVVTGYCALANCEPIDPNAMPPAYQRLSDHCPVVFSLDNADRD
jgi:endonuclease/exonuclease/phosphatase family metal-dependent hydrolase